MKTDLKKQIPSYKATVGRFDVVDVPALQYLMIDGHGDPNTVAAYADALATLYPVAYKLKFFSKGELGRDYVVMPLEALWWADDMDVFTAARDKSRWDWTVMILTPDWITHDHFDEVVGVTGDAPVLELLRLETLAEGRCVQTLHVGSYDDEAPVLAAMHDEYLPANGWTMAGKHHEIYLSDPRRVSPDKLRTILRQPVSRAATH